MRGEHLALGALQQVAHRAVEHARASRAQGRGVLPRREPQPSGFDANERDPRVVLERMEQSDRVAAAPDARHDRVRQAAFDRLHLLPRFATDHRLEIPHERGYGCGPTTEPITYRVVATLV